MVFYFEQIQLRKTRGLDAHIMENRWEHYDPKHWKSLTFQRNWLQTWINRRPLMNLINLAVSPQFSGIGTERSQLPVNMSWGASAHSWDTFNTQAKKGKSIKRDGPKVGQQICTESTDFAQVSEELSLLGLPSVFLVMQDIIGQHVDRKQNLLLLAFFVSKKISKKDLPTC